MKQKHSGRNDGAMVPCCVCVREVWHLGGSGTASANVASINLQSLLPTLLSSYLRLHFVSGVGNL
jgi:hypothetical protein